MCCHNQVPIEYANRKEDVRNSEHSSFTTSKVAVTISSVISESERWNVHSREIAMGRGANVSVLRLVAGKLLHVT